MRKKFCPKCGVISEKLYQSLCKNCFLSKINLSEKFPSKILVKKCRSCNIYFNSFASFDLKIVLKKILENYFKLRNFEIMNFEIKENKVVLKVLFRYEDLEKIEEKEVDINFKKFLCRKCRLRSSGYYEVLIQLRNFDEKIIEEVRNLERIFSGKDFLSFITKISRVKNGFDVFVSKKYFGLEIAKYLKKNYDVKFKFSKKFFGKNYKVVMVVKRV